MPRLVAVFTALFPTIMLISQTSGTMAGIYSNNEIQLAIELKSSSSNSLSGNFNFQGKKYPATAQMVNGRISGTYQFEGNMVPFAIEKSGSNYVLHSEGITLPLTKANLPESTASEPSGAKTAKPLSSSTGSQRKDPYGGYSFKVPDGWSCRQEQEGFVLSIPGKNWQLAVGPHNYASQQAGMAAAAKMEVIKDEATGTFLQPTVLPFANGGIRLTLKGYANNSPLTLETLHIFSPFGGGVSLAAVMPGTADPQAIELLSSFSQQFSFEKPQKSQLVADWESRIRGRQLVYLNTQGGGTEKTTVNLYADGRFDYTSSSSYTSGGYADFSYADKNGGSGSWKIVQRGQQALLLMFNQNGGTEEYPLQQGQQGEVISNGRRYFIRPLQ